MGRSLASKLWVHEPDTFFLEAAREISEKWNFFIKRSVPENFQRENVSGQVPMESLRTQDSENVYERWVDILFCDAASTLLFFLENRVNFAQKHPLPSFTTHIPNRLDMGIHQLASKIYHT